MEKIEERIKNTFINEFIENGLDKDIDVTYLCKKLDITRQTFYYHYKDISDLIMAILLDENMVYEKDFDFDRIIYECLLFLFNREEFNLTLAKSKLSFVLLDFINYYLTNSLENFLVTTYNIRAKSEMAIMLSRMLGNILSGEMIDMFKKENSKDAIFKKIKTIFNENFIVLLSNNVKKSSS